MDDKDLLIQQLKAEIARLKAEGVPVVHGKWKLHLDGSGTCNQCRRTQKAVWDFDNQQNFCGHCGADMR